MASHDEYYWERKNTRIPVQNFTNPEETKTLQFDENWGNEGIIWVMMKDYNTFIIASEYYLKNNFDENNKPLFDSMARMFSAEAAIIFGMLYFNFSRTPGISYDDREKARFAFQDGFVIMKLKSNN